MPLDQPGSIKRDFDAVENHRGDTFCKTAHAEAQTAALESDAAQAPTSAGCHDTDLEFGHWRRPGACADTGRAANLSGLA